MHGAKIKMIGSCILTFGTDYRSHLQGPGCPRSLLGGFRTTDRTRLRWSVNNCQPTMA